MKRIRRAIRILGGAGLVGLPLAALAHLLDGSPDPLPRWVALAGMAIVGIMGGAVGFAISKHRQSMEAQKRLRQQRAASAASAPDASAPPESAP